ncbi:MAG: cohesin domain-containing protein, partial [Ruminococcus sp.]|nr:cohesin domain-containing protein [Ruminococcus sp.]
SSSSKSDSSKSDDSNSKSLKIGGKTFNVGDTIVCTYKLKTPAVLENYQARIKYDSSKLTCKSAKMSEPAKNGAMLNIKIAGEISLSGVNIGDGYDYTNGGTFMTVVYEVKGGGSTSPSYHWEVACRASDSKNLIDKKGKPASGFKLSSSYKD